MSVLTVTHSGNRRDLPFDGQILLSDALQLQHFPLDLPCGGKGTCRQCRVKAQGALSPLTQTERDSLTPAELEQGVRLACLTSVQGDAQVELLPRGELQNIVVDGVIPQFTRNPMLGTYGVSVDIGTTTVAAQLYRLSDCALLSSTSMKNPQAIFGADVISRMEQSRSGKSEQLFYSIVSCINRMACTMAESAQIPSAEIGAMVITGNTAMLYLLTRQNPDCLCHAPFEADRLFDEYLPAEQLGLTATPQATVYLPRCISAFVGADITTAILASGLHHQSQTAMLVDVGTNGEIVLQHGGKLFCCSTAAGPAFEGAGIQMGVNGIAGAVDTVRLENGNILCTTIQNKKAVGICGSGIIDAMAVLCDAGVIDEVGSLQEDGHAFAHRIATLGSDTAFCIDGGNVLLTQRDIRMVQLAKSAICAGMLTLIESAGLKPEDIQQLYIAGGFGSYINLANAARIGLIPKALAKNATAIGNAAASGASMLLQNTGFLPEASALAAETHTVDLTTSPVFLEYYMDCMGFDEP